MRSAAWRFEISKHWKREKLAQENGARDVPARGTFGHTVAAGQSETYFSTEAAASRDVLRSVAVVLLPLLHWRRGGHCGLGL